MTEQILTVFIKVTLAYEVVKFSYLVIKSVNLRDA